MPSRQQKQLILSPQEACKHILKDESLAFSLPSDKLLRISRMKNSTRIMPADRLALRGIISDLGLCDEVRLAD